MNIEEISPPDAGLLSLITARQAWHYRVVPKSRYRRRIIFYLDETIADSLIVGVELQLLLKKMIAFERIAADTLSRALQCYYPIETLTIRPAPDVLHPLEWMDRLLTQAQEPGSGYIYVERHEAQCSVRMLVDGEMVEYCRLTGPRQHHLLETLKTLAQLDSAERRVLQEGSFTLRLSSGEVVRWRVIVLPVAQGEKMVLRLIR